MIDLKEPCTHTFSLADLDKGEGLKKLIEYEKEVFGNNFPAALLVLGGTALAAHYEQLSHSFHVPPIMALGEPITCKSTAVETALSLFGVKDCVGGNIITFTL